MITDKELNVILNDMQIEKKKAYRLKCRDDMRNGNHISCKKMILVFNDEMRNKTRPATKKDYMEWLKIFLENGGEITHFYNYNMPLDDWIVATNDFEIFQLYGTNGKHIIVENRVNVKYGNEGHNNLYFMNHHTSNSYPTFVPVYADIVFGESEVKNINSQPNDNKLIRYIKNLIHILLT